MNNVADVINHGPGGATEKWLTRLVRHVMLRIPLPCAAPRIMVCVKTREMRVCDALRGRWSNREKAYIMAASKETKLRYYIDNGYDGARMEARLIPPQTELNL